MSIPPNRTHPQQPPRESLDHVLYEMEMLSWTYEMLLTGKLCAMGTNAVLESFIVHLRCLNEFFCKGDAQQRMKPWHYVSGYPKEQKEHPSIERMHTEMAHLTYDRKPHGSTDAKGYWLLPDTAQPMFKLSHGRGLWIAAQFNSKEPVLRGA